MENMVNDRVVKTRINGGIITLIIPSQFSLINFLLSLTGEHVIIASESSLSLSLSLSLLSHANLAFSLHTYSQFYKSPGGFIGRTRSENL